jgi:hypothetical protein
MTTTRYKTEAEQRQKAEQWGRARQACAHASIWSRNARRASLIAGQFLIEACAELDHGEKMDAVKREVPDISYDTAARWMDAVGVVKKEIGHPEHDTIEISYILSVGGKREKGLPAWAAKWRKDFFDFTKDKTIKQCLNAVFLDGDESYRLARAINGKTKGGAGDRKNFPAYIDTNLKFASRHTAHWKSMNAREQTSIRLSVRAYIEGDEVENKSSEPKKFRPGLPEDLCKEIEGAIAALRKARQR